MKKLVIFCFTFLFFVDTYAHETDKYFVCHTKDDVLSMLDKLLSMGTRHYELREVRKRNADSDHVVYYEYRGARTGDTDSLKLLVIINFYMEDANPSLEIPGVPVYKVSGIYGAYLDLFPIYQLADPQATMESTSKYGASKDFPDSSGTLHYSLRKRNNPNEWHFRRF